MNGIIITKKNFNDVAARITRLLDGKDIVGWHSYGCGMKKHIPTKIIHYISTPKKSIKLKEKTIRRYSNVEVEIWDNKFLPVGPTIEVTLNNGCVIIYKIGDLIKFCGNRIQSRGVNCFGEVVFQTLQVWDKNGGFKDIEPEIYLELDEDVDDDIE